jgi:hypothetical protein
MKLRIGIDIDNVLADTYVSYIEIFNQKFNTNLKFDQLTDFYYLERHSGVEYKKARDFVYQIIETEEFALNIKPYEMASNVILNWLKRGFYINYITARPQTGQKVTEKWLKENSFWHDNCSLYMQKSVLSDSEFKKNIVITQRIGLMIEDSPEISKNLSVPVLLLDRPWNRVELGSNVHRMEDWLEISKYFDEYIDVKKSQ